MTRPHRRAGRRVAVAAALAAVVVSLALPTGSGANAVPGSSGTDTSLPDTPSAVTVRGRGDFADLQIRVNQTEQLNNQAISISWTGGTPTRANGRVFGDNFLQIMQCWGEDDGTVPGNPGPPPEQCVFGASDAIPGGGRNTTLYAPGSYADDRIIARGSFESYDPDDGFFEAQTNQQWMPFRSVTGDVVNAHTQAGFSPVQGGQYWKNPFFNYVNTNEVAGALTRADGSGQELFEVNTGLENTGLGCGQQVTRSDGTRGIPKCWLVIVPRGDAATENAGTINDLTFEGNPLVMTSPLAPNSWKNRIAIPLEFNPIDTPCELADESARLVGSELVIRAISSWQPELCAVDGLRPYSYAIVADAGARLQVLDPATDAAGMAVISRPVDPAFVSEQDPLVYAPLTLSSLVIGFNIERVPDAGVVEPGSPADRLRGIRIAELNLTPRLVAKLLTQSYRGQVSIFSPPPDSYGWVEDNPTDIDLDPDFVRFNPEFELLTTRASRNMGGLILAAGLSDAAQQVWEWILADPEAAAWLAGEPDEWGMRVNPYYATDAGRNPSGLPFAPPTPTSFPKGDPACHQAASVDFGGREIVPPLICGTDWMPYAGGYREAAQSVRAANDQSRLEPNGFAETAQQYWRASGPQIIGGRGIMALVDSASAAQYGLQTARLSRAGDNGPDRTFVAPDDQGATRAVGAMERVPGTTVLVPDPTADVDGAYPLSILTYGAVTPVSITEQQRTEYAALIGYATGPGQVPGEEIGQLPPGYTPLPAALVAQADEAVATILDPPDPATGTPTPTPGAPVAPGGVVPVDSGVGGLGGGTGSGAPSAPTDAPTDTPAPVDIEPPADDEDVESASPGVTAASSVGVNRWILPVFGLVMLLSALLALEVTKRPRRATGRTADEGAPS